MAIVGYSLCVLGYVISCLHAATVSFIQPCKLEDSACVLSSSQAAVPYLAAGIPDLGIHPFEPLGLEKVRGDQGELLLEFRDLQVAGLSKCKFIGIQITDMAKVSFEVDCPILATGKYTVGGKLMFIHIEGDGPFELKTDKIRISVNGDVETIEGADGKKRWNITKLDYSYTPEERIYIKLENLFNGNEEKAKPILEILNHSWKELILEIGRPIVDQLVQKLRNIINEFFKAVPQDELYIK